MKILCLMLMAMILTFVQARATETFLPDNLQCTSEAKSFELQEFTITQLNSGKPQISLNVPWINTDVTATSLSFDFSNSEDNMFSLSFQNSSLRDLKLGRVSTIPASLKYWLSGLKTGHEDEEGNLTEEIAATCRKLK